MANQLSAIDHIVVLALENRSFDHMLGFLYTAQGNRSPRGQAYEGLTGNESNPDSKGKRVKVFKITAGMKNAYFMPGADPGENYAAVNQQLFNANEPPVPPIANNQGFLLNFTAYIPRRAALPKIFGVLPGTVPKDIMGMFAPETLPVMSALARSYAVCDHWFASVPTQTMPNRAFMCAATSTGKMDDKRAKPWVNVPSIFGRLSDKGLKWVIYGYADDKPLTRTDFPDTLNATPDHFGKFSDFRAAAAAGKLPPYAFLEPEWSRTGNSQHPNYDVALGEQLIHDVYSAVRNGKHWNKTLLIITYDEHGGNYDHVPPPLGATPPDDSVSSTGFDFKRFGVRVPTLLISPLIEPGTVFRVPDGTTPFDHTSILKTVEKRWNLLPLTRRDAAASDVGDVLTRVTPRTDDALKGVKPPKSGGHVPNPSQPSEIQVKHAQALADFSIPDDKGRVDHEMPNLRTGADFAKFIRQRTAAIQKAKDRDRPARPRRPAAVQPRGAAPVTTGGTGPRQIVLLRHAEKSADPRNPDLSPAGLKRADMLATAIPQTFGRPDFLIATAPSKNSNRPTETLTPLARALTMPIDTSVPDIGYGEVSANLLHQPRYAGKLVVVCWHHGNLPDLALGLKVPKEQIRAAPGMDGLHWEAEVFDLFWSITFDGGTPTLEKIKQPDVP